MKPVSMGIDLGSVSINLVLCECNGEIVYSDYSRTWGDPLNSIYQILEKLERFVNENNIEIQAVGTTGSGRHLAKAIIGGGIAKNEITSHATGTLHFIPDATTIIEIGGQDSKAIFLNQGIVVDFSMNTVCAAGTGSFLDQQAMRLNLSIEEFGKIGLQSKKPARIAGRCTVFAESDMIHKQQMGISREDIVMGLCEALVRNYLSGTAGGRKIKKPVVFQGGVAYNYSIRKAFEKILGFELLIPPCHEVMGAFGISLLAWENGKYKLDVSARKEMKFTTASFLCKNCNHNCEIMELRANENPEAKWGGRCDRWE